MADYRLSASVISRSDGRSATAAVAYRSGERIEDERTREVFDYTRKQGVVHSEILLPEHAPERWHDRERLWNDVELAETRKNSQVAREVQLSLPRELERAEQVELTRSFVQHQFVERGMCADISIHDNGGGNPHAHIMLTTRECDMEGFTNKQREWNDKELLMVWRKEWEVEQNQSLFQHYEQQHVPEQERSYVDCRSLKEQGIEREPQLHMGRAWQIEQQEEQRAEREGREYEPVTDRGQQQQEIIQRNIEREVLAMQIRQLEFEKRLAYEREQQHQQQLATERSRVIERTQALAQDVGAARQDVSGKAEERAAIEQRIERLETEQRGEESTTRRLDERIKELQPETELVREFGRTPRQGRGDFFGEVARACDRARAAIEQRVGYLGEGIKHVSEQVRAFRETPIREQLSQLRERVRGAADRCIRYYKAHKLEINAAGLSYNQENGRVQELNWDKTYVAREKLGLNEEYTAYEHDYSHDYEQDMGFRMRM